MPTIQQRYPGATVEVLSNGVVVPPENYEAEGITLTMPADGTFELSAPDIGGTGRRYDVRITPVTAIVAEPVRVTVLEFPGEEADFQGAGTDLAEGEVELLPYLITSAGDWTSVHVYAGRSGV